MAMADRRPCIEAVEVEVGEGRVEAMPCGSPNRLKYVISFMLVGVSGLGIIYVPLLIYGYGV